MRLSKLIGKIHEDCGNVTKFCDEFGLDYGYMSRLLNGKNDFKKSSVVRIAHALSIEPQDIGIYFFPECCATAETHTNE